MSNKKTTLINNMAWIIFFMTLSTILVFSLRLSDDQDIVNILSIGGWIVSFHYRCYSYICIFFSSK